MSRPSPAETKLLICVWHAFTLWRPPRDVAVHIQQRWPEMRVVHLPTYDHLEDEIRDTDIFVGYSLRPHQFRAATKLKWIHATAAGVNQLMFPELRNSDVVVTNSRGIHALPMAEHIVGMLVALARRFPSAFRHQMQRKWAQQEIWDEPIRPRELHGQTVLFVGFGAIGREVARRLLPMGMRLWAVTRSGKAPSELVERVLPATELNAALPEADFVILAAPETPETINMFSTPQFLRMKPTAFLINVARGSLIDESALVEALRRRDIAGAALDVAREEPLPASSPLWELDNIIITPHISAVSEFLWDRQTRLLLENLERWFAGRELLNLVDKQRGY